MNKQELIKERESLLKYKKIAFLIINIKAGGTPGLKTSGYGKCKDVMFVDEGKDPLVDGMVHVRNRC